MLSAEVTLAAAFELFAAKLLGEEELTIALLATLEEELMTELLSTLETAVELTSVTELETVAELLDGKTLLAVKLLDIELIATLEAKILFELAAAGLSPGGDNSTCLPAPPHALKTAAREVANTSLEKREICIIGVLQG